MTQEQKSNRFYGLVAVFVALIAVGIIWFVGSSEADQPAATAQAQIEQKTPETKPEIGNIYTYTKLFDAIAWRINAGYMEEVDTKDLIYSGIRGMLEILDPFSVMMEKKSYERLMESTHGKYEGLGMAIDSRDNYIVVMSPLEGTPAYQMGIQAGDRIIKIDDKSTFGMTTEEAAKLMRGPKGTTVVITVQREGIPAHLEYTLKRDVIQIRSVPYYGVTEENLGYVRLASFSEESSKELRDAIRDLKNKNIKGLIFDLRSNGGGLLDQAVEVASLYLDENRLVVYTQGRSPADKTEYSTRGKAVFGDNLPLVVLVDGATASASEIVSGAIQDWDRGLIVGNTTYGKGLVQRVFEVNSEVALKLTTAKYYIPSGRCIQKPERSVKHPKLIASTQEEELLPDSIIVKEEPTSEEVFHTIGGRVVYGGGGVAPDISVETEKMNSFEANLYSKQLAFDFAVRYTAGKKLPLDFEVSDQMVEEFRIFLKEKQFDYKTPAEVYLDSLSQFAQREGKLEIYSQALESLRSQVAREKEQDFEISKGKVKRLLKETILRKLYGEKGYYEGVVLKEHPAVLKAKEVLLDPKQYKKLLQG